MDKIIYEIQKGKFNEDLKEDLISIYKEYRETGGSDPDLRRRVEAALEGMFRNDFNYTIPMDFIDSEVGKMLFRVKLDMTQIEWYGAIECAVISGKTRSAIVKDMAPDKILKGQKIGGHYYVTEERLFEYLTTSGWHPLSEKEAKERIQYFRSLQEKCEDMKEIETLFSERYPRKYKIKGQG